MLIGREDLREENLVSKTIKERYELRDQIQTGGFGITWLAWDTMLKMPVCVKECKDSDQKRKEKFLAEARNLARFSKEAGIVNVRDYMEEDGSAYLVMEYLDGRDLKTYIEEEGPVSFEEALEMMRPVINVVTKMHAAGIIHRDISPDNIRILPDGTIKLLDFGSVIDMGQEDGKTMTVMVKPGYAPSEQYLDQSMQGTWTDVYALCATLYKCITKETPVDSLRRSFQDELPLPSVLGGQINAACEEILMKGMAVNPKERIATTEELLNRFEQALGRTAGKIQTEPSVTGERREEHESERQTVSKIDNVPLKEPKTSSKKKNNKKTENKKTENKRAGNKKRGTRKKTTIAKMILGVLAGITAVMVFLFVLFHDPYRDGDSNYAYIKNETVTSSMLRKIDWDRNVTKLNFYQCQLDEEMLEKIAAMKRIDSISLDGCSGFTTLKSLADMEGLQSIEINQAYTEEKACDGNLLFDGDFSQIRNLTLTMTEFSGDSSFLNQFPGLTKLYLDSTGISDLSFLKSMSDLERLFLHDLDLSGDRSVPIGFCKKLKVLNCDETGLSDISWADGLSDLEEFSAIQCSLLDIRAVSSLGNLKKICMGSNQITDIRALGGCENLEYADFSNNQIQSIDALTGKEKLNTLILDTNMISDLSALKDSLSLTEVRLKNNQIMDISVLGGCERLQALDVENNRITDLSGLGNCTALELLSLSKNQITSLDACERMIKLKHLYAGDNQITNIDKLTNCTKLKHLTLENNQILDISALENHFTELSVLNLNNNRVSSLEPLKESQKLSVLYADHNEITDLSGLEGKSSLKALLLYDNQITDISPLADSLNKLAYLDFGKNQIADISVLSGMSSGKKVLLLEDNQISDIRMLPKDINYLALTLYGNPLYDISIVKEFTNINSMYGMLYLSHQEDLDYSAVAESKFADKIHLVDVPLDRQASLLAELKKDKFGAADPVFETTEEADAKMSEYRSELEDMISDPLS